ncbi:hypothetical protein M3Y94_01312300 [Aphelenchoides besseyi]|nr:hypothetical protein M3Y94_01312300 [Aphelenchoides besseyi]KAI6220283.1 hypothetical protein M3Y95_01068700 [Aphelenchoides besseyi]
MTKSKYDEYYAVNIKDNEVVYKCMHAQCNFTYIRTSGKSPASLRSHLKDNHAEDFRRLEVKEMAQKMNVSVTNGPGALTTSGEAVKKPKKPRAKKTDSATAVRVKADPNSTIMQPPITQQPIVHQPLIQQPVAMPTSQFSPTSRFDTTPRQPLPMITEQQHSLKRAASSDYVSLQMMPAFCSTSMFNQSGSIGSDFNPFGQYIGQRLDSLSTPKRRKLELQMMMILNEAEFCGSNMVMQNNQQFY